ncbi:MAG TPA: class II fructose-bisphosphate aldolase, partial [Candidatus Wildermuthbacteria bacterium]|nr:class II fructose-bisphosphate aldolase [Candidatus Wildermuthbacteria bacterium]
TLEQLNAIVSAAVYMKGPVLVGTSENESKFVGMLQAVALVKSFQEQGIAVFLNADHFRSVEGAKEAVDAGYDSVNIDLSKESFEKNLKGTKEVVEYAKKKKVNVEGELGYLVTDSSKVYEEEISIPEESYTKVEEAMQFVKESRVDRFSPAIGTIHGIAANAPSLRLDLAKELSKALNVSLVLHGGSGVGEDDMKAVIASGFNNIHVSTELRVAYGNKLRETLKAMPDEIAPYKYLKDPREAVMQLVQDKMKLFSAVDVL